MNIAHTSRDHVSVITPDSAWRMFDIRELWTYRELLWVLGARDVKVRYKQTLLGAGWAIFRPLLTMLVFTMVFGRLAKIPSDGYPYDVWVYAALLPWTFFTTSVAASGQSLVGSAHLVSKVYFPRLLVPLSAMGAPLVDFVVSATVLFALMAWHGVALTTRLVAAPLLLLGLLLTAVGVGALSSALMVSYRDLSHVLPFALQIWMYATPVVYPASLIPGGWHWLLYLNPAAGLVEGFRSAFLGKPFDIRLLVASAIGGTVLFLVGIAYFQKVERRFADVI
jgi:lipopolysaccharide transport system permease protein